MTDVGYGSQFGQGQCGVVAPKANLEALVFDREF